MSPDFVSTPGHPTVRGANAGDLHVLDAAHPAPSGALHVGAHHVDGARHAVDLQPCAAEQVVGAHQRVEVPDLLGRDDLHSPESECVVGVGEPLEFGKAVAAVRDGDAPDLSESGRLPGLGLQFRQEVARVGAELRVGVAVPGGADEPRRVPARAGRELLSLEEDDIRPSQLCEVIGNARAGHAAADDNRARTLRQCLVHRRLPRIVLPCTVIRLRHSGARTSKLFSGGAGPAFPRYRLDMTRSVRRFLGIGARTRPKLCGVCLDAKVSRLIRWCEIYLQSGEVLWPTACAPMKVPAHFQSLRSLCSAPDGSAKNSPATMHVPTSVHRCQSTFEKLALRDGCRRMSSCRATIARRHGDRYLRSL